MSCNDLYHYSVVVNEVFQMTSKKVKKSSKKRAEDSVRTAKAEEKPPDNKENNDADDGKVDYGGLPAIDLKKNLGCG